MARSFEGAMTNNLGIGPSVNCSHPRPFTHIVYADFSGDDGDLAKEGSSRNLCMAWVVSRSEDVDHNLGVVADIKRHIRCQPNDELKYSALKRHKKKFSALEILSTARVQVLTVLVVKERLRDERLRDPKTKALVHLMHEFPLLEVLKRLVQAGEDPYIQLIYDQIGWRGSQDAIRNHFLTERRLDTEGSRDDWLHFTDWRKHQLLQLADVLAGLGNEYASGLDKKGRPPCEVCFIRRRSKGPVQVPKHCRGVAQLGNVALLQLLRPLLIKNRHGDVHEVGFIARPKAVIGEYGFVDCPIVVTK